MTTDDGNEYGRKAIGLEKQELYAVHHAFLYIDARLRDSA